MCTFITLIAATKDAAALNAALAHINNRAHSQKVEPAIPRAPFSLLPRIPCPVKWCGTEAWLRGRKHSVAN